MLYKFKCKATGELIMLGPQGDQLLRLLGREPSAQGIVEPEVMVDARERLQAAIAEAEAQPQEAPGGDDDPADEARARRAIGLRQRLWPMLQMLERAQAAGEPIVWGV